MAIAVSNLDCDSGVLAGPFSAAASVVSGDMWISEMELRRDSAAESMAKEQMSVLDPSVYGSKGTSNRARFV